MRVRLILPNAKHVGENIAGYSTTHMSHAIREMCSGWMRSPGHRRTVMTHSYRYTGVGVGIKNGKMRVVQVFCVDPGD